MRTMRRTIWLVSVMWVVGGSSLAFAQQSEAGQQEHEGQQQAEQQEGEQQQEAQQREHEAGGQEQQGQQQAEQQEGEQQQEAQREQQAPAHQQQREQRAQQQRRLQVPSVEELRGVRAAIRFQALNESIVRKMQSRLKNQGHYEGEADGSVGPQTQQALRSFQQTYGLEPTGQLDLQTARALNIGVFEEVRPVRGIEGREPGAAPMEQRTGADQPAVEQQRGEQQMQQRAAIRAAQRILKDQDIYDGEVDGLMGPKTRDAFREFQRQNDLEVTGELDAATRQALDLPEQPVIESRQQQPEGKSEQQGAGQAPQGEQEQMQQEQQQEQQEQQEQQQHESEHEGSK